MLSERQEQIIEESINLIAEKGIQGFTIKNLSKAIGISEPGIYRHFENKTQILLTILDGFTELAEMLSGLINNNKLSTVQKISFMFNKMVERFKQSPSLVSVIFSEEIFKNEDVLRRKIIKILNTNEDTLEAIIRTGQKNNEIRTDSDEKVLALMVMGSLRLLVKRWDLNGHKFDLSKEGKLLLNSIEAVLSV
ncbi:MAG: TetR/AcrR family transcriptional regulator [Bacteroidales bacterium]|nr:TetR/AcrR family transcriptional regulator [Bacteroidales bacterium]